MTIKWGDPIECNGVRPDWLRDNERVRDIDPGCATNGIERAAKNWNWTRIKAFCVRDDHPAYVALARGFHPWSGGESAPDDWDGGTVLLRDGTEWPHYPTWTDCGTRSIIGYNRKLNAEVPFDRGEMYVRIVPFTRAEWYAVPDYTAWAQSVGLIRPESRAERFTRETGHAVTEAVEAALNWKES